MKFIFYTLSIACKKNIVLLFTMVIMFCANARSPFNDGNSGLKGKSVSGTTGLKAGQHAATTKSAAPVLACPCTLFAPTDVPGTIGVNDALPIEVGVKFQADVNGFILGIRFYKSASDPATTHTGTLWDNTGTSLGTATTVTETASGWQQADFVTPISITAATTYVASFYNAGGWYSYTNNTFLADVVVPPLTGLSEGGANGNNGVYNYDLLAAGTVFPTAGNSATNYWVDPVFSQTNVLPVSLVNFKTKTEKNDVLLTWQTQMEENNLGFEIQRSTDGATWSDVAFVKGAGESNSLLDYNYTDKNLSPDHYSYRLKQINFDNNFKLSLVVSAAILGDKGITLSTNFPNPFVDHTTIQYSVPRSMKVRVTVWDVQGRQIKVLVNETAQTGTHTVVFNSKGISSGIYYYKLETDGQGTSIVRKMVINR